MHVTKVLADEIRQLTTQQLRQQLRERIIEYSDLLKMKTENCGIGCDNTRQDTTELVFLGFADDQILSGREQRDALNLEFKSNMLINHAKRVSVFPFLCPEVTF